MRIFLGFVILASSQVAGAGTFVGEIQGTFLDCWFVVNGRFIGVVSAVRHVQGNT